jgi:hypothetical protein
VIACDPVAVYAAATHVATPAVTVLAPQPVIVADPSLNSIVPVAPLALTVAV